MRSWEMRRVGPAGTRSSSRPDTLSSENPPCDEEELGISGKRSSEVRLYRGNSPSHNAGPHLLVTGSDGMQFPLASFQDPPYGTGSNRPKALVGLYD